MQGGSVLPAKPFNKADRVKHRQFLLPLGTLLLRGDLNEFFVGQGQQGTHDQTGVKAGEAEIVLELVEV